MTQPPTGGTLPPSGEPEPRHRAPAPPQAPPWGGPWAGEPPSPPPPGGGPAWPTPPAPPVGPPPRRRGLLIASIVVAVLVVLCGSGGVAAFLLLRDAEAAAGAAEPVAAVDGFLRAVYTEHDAEKAGALVCSEARDEAAIGKKVEEVEQYTSRYARPRFRWSPPKIDEQTNERARVSTTLVMNTGDEKVAEQRLSFTVIKKTGWWVCEVGG